MQTDSPRPRLVYVTTHGVSALGLMRGQLALMRERGFEVIVIASPSAELDAVAIREDVQTVGIPMEREISPLTDLRSLLYLIRELRQLKPDIVNAGTPKAGVLGMLAAFIARVPSRIYTLRGLRLETTRGLKAFILSMAERVAAACAQRVVCVSHSLRATYLQRRLARASKCIVLASGSSNGVNVRRFQLTDAQHAETRAIRERHGIPADAPVIGFVGRLTRDKGIVELYDAFRKLKLNIPDLRLMLVGDFESGDPVPAATVAGLRSDPNVTITGFVANTELYFDCMSLLAFPSYREGFPNVPLEAAASGLPVVGFAATGTVDAVLDGVTGTIVPCGDTAALASAIQRYLTDDLLKFRHGDAGRQRVAREFRNETVWNALIDLYISLLPERRRPQPADAVVTKAA